MCRLFLLFLISTVVVGDKTQDAGRSMRRAHRTAESVKTVSIGSTGDVEKQMLQAPNTGHNTQSDAFSFDENSGCKHTRNCGAQEPRYKFLYPSHPASTLPLGVFIEESDQFPSQRTADADDGTSVAVVNAFQLAANTVAELKGLITKAFPDVAPEAERYFDAATLGLTAVSQAADNFMSDDPSEQAAGAEILWKGLMGSVETALSAQEKATQAYATYSKVVGNISGALNGIGGIVKGFQQGLEATNSCWKDSQGRGVGTIPKNCSAADPEKTDYDAGLCYKPCPSGYKGVGPVCWRNSLGRGLGSAPFSLEDSNRGCGPNMEPYAGLCYQLCPDGWKGEGTSCIHESADKASYSRGVGKIPGCKDGMSMSVGLCYPNCRNGFVGQMTRCIRVPGSETDDNSNTGGICAKRETDKDSTGSKRASKFPDGAKANSAEDCCRHCQGDSSCIAYVYQPSAGNCWPLSKSGGTRDAKDRVYGVVERKPDVQSLSQASSSGGSLLDINISVSGSENDDAPVTPTSYSRGQHGKPEPCKSDQEKWGALCYPKCRPGFQPIGCCICQTESYDRGLGSVPGFCKSDEEKIAGLCYPKCRDYYKGIGPLCWREVKSRGGGKVPTDCPEGWEVNQGLCYKTCKDGYKGEGPLCHPVDKSTQELRTLSVTRGVGVPPGCDADKDKDAGLCYTPCPSGFKGVGPVCWHKCKDPLPTDGGAMCCDTQQTCTQKGLDMAFGIIGGGVTAGIQFVAGQYGSGLNTLASKAATPFAMPKCDELHKKLAQGGGLLEDLLWPVASQLELIEAAGLVDYREPEAASLVHNPVPGVGTPSHKSRSHRNGPRPIFMYTKRSNGLSGPPVGVLMEEDMESYSSEADASADVEEGVILGFKAASMAVGKVQQVIEELLPDVNPKAVMYLKSAVQGLGSIAEVIPSLTSDNPVTVGEGVEDLWTKLLSSVDTALTDEQKQTKGYLTYHSVTRNISAAIEGLGGIIGSYQQNLNSEDACWKTGKGRGVGTPAKDCADNKDGKTEFQAGLCYKPCPSGMNGVGPICWRKSYSRGIGKIPGASDKSNNHGCPEDMEYHLGLCYQKCPPGWKGVGPACHPENAKEMSMGRGIGTPMQCPSDMENSAGLCYKKCKDGFRGSMTQCYPNGGGLSGAHYRGLGKIPSACGADQDKQGSLCYAKCKDGYKGIGPVCWRVLKNRGAGSIPGNCAKDHELSESLCYKKCKTGHIGKGPLCHSTDDNGEMMTASKDRGVGVIPSCEQGKEYQAGLCYTPCPSGFKGIGPVCWHICRDPLPADSGAMCCDSPATCTKRGLDQFFGILSGGISAATNFLGKNYGGGIKSIAGIGSPFALPQCDDLHDKLGAMIA